MRCYIWPLLRLVEMNESILSLLLLRLKKIFECLSSVLI